MQLSSARFAGKAGGVAPGSGQPVALHASSRVTRSITIFVVLLLAAALIGIASPSTSKPAGADTPIFASGQVFASVGNSAVNVYSQGVGNPLVTRLNDGLQEPFTAGSAFDSSGNFYVADDYSGDVSEYAPDGTLDGVFASGLSNPLSLVFDNQGNLYVGQQTTPYIAEFSKTGQFVQNIGPLATELTGDDWIALGPDECTIYYTTEGSDILRYDMCHNQQLPNLNVQSFPTYDASTNLPVEAFELQILPDGDVLVADSNADILLDPNGNVLQTYTCASLPDCQGALFAVSLDPDGNSFWTGDSNSGYVWKIDTASGDVLQTINTRSGALYGLSVDDQIEVAAAPTVVSAAPTALAIQPVTGNFSSPTPVTAVLTNSTTNAPIVNEPVTFTLNGSETCTADTDATGTATCVITPGEPASSYTLTASFSGDTSSSTPEGSDFTNSTFTVTPDSSTVTYTGPTTAVNGAPTTLSGTLSTNTPTSGTPLPTKVVTFTVGSGSTSQSCSGTTDANGNVSCSITPDQPVSDTQVSTSFGGDVYDTPTGTTTSATVTEPTTLTVNPGTSDFSDATTVSGVLTDASNAPVAGEPVTFALNGAETCTAKTDATGTASCSITPGEPAATYTLTGNFTGDTTLQLQLMKATGVAAFVVTLEETALTYTGATTAQNGQPVTLSGVLTTDNPVPGSGLGGRTVSFTLGSGSSAQICSGTTNSAGAVSCSVTVTGQPPGPIPVADTFAGDAYYRIASAASTVNIPEGTQLTVNPGGGTYNGSTTISGTLVNTVTNQPVPNEPVTLTVNGTQSCMGTTNAAGVASCPVTPNEPAGTYSTTATFGGDSSQVPQLLPTGGSGTFTVTLAPTTFAYTGTTSVTNGQSATLSGVLTTNEPTPGTDVSGQMVTFTLGSGSSLQSCSGTTNTSGAASCTIAIVNQTSGTVGISASYGGSTDYHSSTGASTATVHTPTTLTVSAGTSDFADAGTVSAVLTNSITGATISGEPVTLTLNGTQSCNATTNASGVASCSITPNEPAATYSLTATFGGDMSKAPQLLSSAGKNNYIVTLEESGIAYTGPTVAVIGSSFTLSANLTTDGSPLGGRAVVMTLGSGSTAQSCTGTTDATGNASCTIASVNQTSGTAPIAVTFAGDAYYRPASAPASAIIAGVADTGGFVIGDISANTPPAPMHPYTSLSNGSQVNFWGSQTWKTNQFSGVNNAPASMKGYVDNAPPNLGLIGNPGCGETWTSNPGNSSSPPATIPNYLIVIVASQITKSGSTESGNIVHVVVVQVEPSYGPSPGHTGWGPIVAWLC